MSANIHFDCDEGRYVRELCCLTCHEQVNAIYTFAVPVRMYEAALSCDQCGEQLVEFDAMTRRTA